MAMASQDDFRSVWFKSIEIVNRREVRHVWTPVYSLQYKRVHDGLVS